MVEKLVKLCWKLRTGSMYVLINVKHYEKNRHLHLNCFAKFYQKNNLELWKFFMFSSLCFNFLYGVTHLLDIGGIPFCSLINYHSHGMYYFDIESAVPEITTSKNVRFRNFPLFQKVYPWKKCSMPSWLRTKPLSPRDSPHLPRVESINNFWGDFFKA